MSITPAHAKAIFLAALEKDGPERAAFLNGMCAGDPALRQRIDAMLTAHAASGELLQRAAADMLGDASGAHATADQYADELGYDAGSDEILTFLAPPAREGTLGRLGHYHVEQVVGRGGFGIVLKAFDEKLHRAVAIKVLAPALAANAAARQRFIGEARAAAAVTHEHVVAIHAIEEDQRPPFIVMQFVDGVSLQEKLDRKGPLELREILRIGVQIAEGLEAAHNHGVVHRDIKPANILLENGVERVKITDFGLARTADDASLSQSGTVAGTPMYMSPEQARGEPVDQRSDLFSFGSVLYTMCTGRPPFRAASTLAVMRRVCEDVPTPVQNINSDIPEWLAAIVARLHAKNPADRFPGAQEAADLLRQHLAHVQHPNGPATPVEGAPPTGVPWPTEADLHRAGEILGPTMRRGLSRLYQSALIGLAIGGAIGFGLGVTDSPIVDTPQWFDSKASMGFVEGAGVGLWLGALVGLVRWVLLARIAWEVHHGLRNHAGQRNARPAMTPGARTAAWLTVLPIAAGVFVVVVVLLAHVWRNDDARQLPTNKRIVDGQGNYWGNVVDTGRAATFITEADGVTINIGKGIHELTLNHNRSAPRALQRVKGDFDMQVKVLPFPGPPANTTAPDRRSPSMSAGLLCWQDRKNYLLFSHAAGPLPDMRPHRVELLIQEAGIGGRETAANLKSPDSALSLRITRRDGCFHCLYSTDGATWMDDLPGNRVSALTDELYVGIVATNVSMTPHRARFRHFDLKTLP